MKHVLIGLIVFISGCAGLHSMPPNGYSKSDDSSSLRVFFDQYGDLYPSSPEALMPEQKIFGSNTALSIRTHMENTGQAYTREDIEKHYINLVAAISGKLKSENSKLVFLVHGYNNSYDEARTSFDYIKSFLKSNSKISYVFVEVYWDGLFKGPFSSPLPLAYWFDSLTYSNVAGQVGLRKLINKLPADTDLTIVTHSRGAGVAFSAISNPIYDSHIVVPDFEEFDGRNISNLNIVSIAPAVGNGHPMGDLTTMLPARSKVFIGFNENDPALQKSQGKIKVGSNKFGDTSLGTDNEFYMAAARSANVSRTVLQRVVYEGYSDHAIKGYVDNENQTKCLFWASSLLDEKPSACPLTR